MDPLDVPIEVDPFTLPPERHGWRGLSVPGHRKRKWWTLLHNDTVLVTALLLIPGERSVRHSHETGELSIHYDAALHPIVAWHPPGELHPSIGTPAAAHQPVEIAAVEAILRRSRDHFGIRVDDLDAAYAQLKERGATFTTEPRTIRPGVKIAFIQCPDNVRIELLERSAPG